MTTVTCDLGIRNKRSIIFSRVYTMRHLLYVCIIRAQCDICILAFRVSARVAFNSVYWEEILHFITLQFRTTTGNIQQCVVSIYHRCIHPMFQHLFDRKMTGELCPDALASALQRGHLALHGKVTHSLTIAHRSSARSNILSSPPPCFKASPTVGMHSPAHPHLGKRPRLDLHSR